MAKGKRKISTEDQLEKLNSLTKEAGEYEGSEILTERIGALTVYANMVDFFVAILCSRTAEMLAVEIAASEGVNTQFQPAEYFVKLKKPTRQLIKALLSFEFHPKDEKGRQAVSEIEKVRTEFADAARAFLDERDKVMHRLASLDWSMDEINEMLNKAIPLYHRAAASQHAFMKATNPACRYKAS